MGEIKSAREVALEKVKNLEKASPEELNRWKYIPEGEALTVKYLKGDCNLLVELTKYDDKVRKYVAEGAQEILLRNIDLPKNDLAKSNNRLAMEAIKELKRGRVKVENVYSKLRRIFTHYEQEGEKQRKQAYESLKQDFEQKVQQAMQQQMGFAARVKIDVTRQPQFQEEWRRLSRQLDSQYYVLLEECRQEIMNIP